MTSLATVLATVIQIFIYAIVLQGFLSFIPRNPYQKGGFRVFLDAATSWYLNFFIKGKKNIISTNFGFILSFMPLIIIKSILLQYSYNQTITLGLVLAIVVKTFWFNLFLWFFVFFIILLIVYLAKGNNPILANVIEKILSKTYLIFYKGHTASDKKLAITALVSLIVISTALTIGVNALVAILI